MRTYVTNYFEMFYECKCEKQINTSDASEKINLSIWKKPINTELVKIIYYVAFPRWNSFLSRKSSAYRDAT